MATCRRNRTIAAAPERLWEVIEDPHHLPRWWPGVSRVEGVTADRWTQVLMTRKGRPVRADFHLVASDPPHSLAWEQEVAGTPFERVLLQSVTEVRLEPDGPGSEATKVTIEQRHKMKGYSRTGGWQVKRAAAKRLDEALDGLERISW